MNFGISERNGAPMGPRKFGGIEHVEPQPNGGDPRQNDLEVLWNYHRGRIL